MKVSVVTGGCGFLGRAVVRRLREEGRTVVVLDDLSTPGSRGSLPEASHLLEARGRGLVEGTAPVVVRRINLAGSFEMDADVLADAIVWALRDAGLGAPGVRVDIEEVWHLASPASPPLYKKRRLETLRLGTRVLDALLELCAAQGARLLFASSSEVYGEPDETPQIESYRGNVSTIGPRSCYDEAKRAGESFCAAAREELGVDARIVRIFNTYGPGMLPEDGRLVPMLLGAIARGTPFEIRGGGGQTRSFSYVDDTIAGLFAVMRAETWTGPTNVGGDLELSVCELVELCRSLFGPLETVSAPAEDEHDPQRRCPSLVRLKALGWGPSVDLSTGLRRTMDWIRSLPETSP